MESIEKMNNMTLNEFLKLYTNMTLEEKTNLINNEKILDLSNENFRVIILNSDINLIGILLSKVQLYDKLMSLAYSKKSILSILEKSKLDILKLVIESPYAHNYFEIFKNFILSLEDKKIDNLSKNIDLKNPFINTIENLKEYLEKNIYDKDENFNDLCDVLLTKIKNGLINPIYVFKLKNSKELMILAKFRVFVNIKYTDDSLIFPSNTVFPYDFIFNIKDKYITKLILLLEQKGEALPYEYLEVALKLYLVFGFDDSKKILEGKFNNLNENCIKKIVDFTFKDLRREYRARNQDKFYFYGMEQNVIDSLINNDNTIFENILYNPSEENINNLRKEFLLIIHDYNNTSELNEKIKDKLCEKINEREKISKSRVYEEVEKRILRKMSEDKIVDTKVLFKLLKDLDIYQIVYEYGEETISKLKNFLLGNRKYNNDCLFRLILNDEAMGLNGNLGILINNFDLLETVTNSSNLSLYSILDIIDILKMDLYELAPNEQDISLETLTRLINSTEYKVDNEVDVLKEICKIHVERKKKTYSNIPTVNGKTEDFSYFVAPFDAEFLLAAGNDGKNCFRVSALGQNFFEYCLKDKSAVVIYLIDKDGKKFVCPTIRSGNGIHCNGIDPPIKPGDENRVLKALSMCFKDILQASYKQKRDHHQNIEIATITDLHLEEYFLNNNFEKYELKRPLPLDEPCYCDYNKPEINNYVLAKSHEYIDESYYVSMDKFYQKRDKDYEFDVNKEYDKERLYMIINSIFYSSIDFQNLQDLEKNRRKREFEPLDIDNFKYITGNKDWFVAIDNNYNLISCLLPYDPRAKENYFTAISKAPHILEKLIGETHDRKNI